MWNIEHKSERCLAIFEVSYVHLHPCPFLLIVLQYYWNNWWFVKGIWITNRCFFSIMNEREKVTILWKATHAPSLFINMVTNAVCIYLLYFSVISYFIIKYFDFCHYVLYYVCHDFTLHNILSLLYGERYTFWTYRTTFNCSYFEMVISLPFQGSNYQKKGTLHFRFLVGFVLFISSKCMSSRIFSSVRCCPVRLSRKKDVQFVFIPIWLKEVNVVFGHLCLFTCTGVQLDFISDDVRVFNNNTAVALVTSGSRTASRFVASEFTAGF